jgi:lantibiotic leader peptide-processing serine protease
VDRRTLVRSATVACVALVAALAGTLSGATAATTSGDAQTYLVVYKSATSPTNAAASLKAAGGTVITNYSQIGVAVVQSSSSTFRSSVMRDSRVSGVSATARFATSVGDGSLNADSSDSQGPPPGDLPNSPASDSDSLSGLQWDMAQIHAPEAHAITGGSPSVLVGDIDTGLDYTHPDLAANVDDAASVNCVSGAPVQGKVAAMDDNGHGTHTAGTIAAAANGIGIVGVAPNVKIAGIKAGNADGFFFPEAVVCAFVWAGTHGVEVTNNSYFADPWLFNCKNDPAQRAIWTAEQRAIMFAEQQGVTVVAAAGNQFEDISHPSLDNTSPDDTSPIVDRRVTNACAIVPVEVPGVVGVSATGNDLQDTSAGAFADNLKSFYSSFGISEVQVTAPGGDSVFGRTTAAPNGRVLSTWPASLENVTCLPARRVIDASGATYCYQQGTSMASPHATGVAALILSQYGPMSRGGVVSILQGTADAQVCPGTLPAGYDSFVGFDDHKVQTCQGGAHSSWYGNGQVDALNAVTHAVN